MISEEQTLITKDLKIINKKVDIIINISYNHETGKLTISDNNNNQYLCDLFGRVKTKFLPNVTGQASYTQRQNYYSKNSKIQKREIFNRPNTSKPLFLSRKGPIEYHPTTKKFEGSSKFPRPLSTPFSNIPDYQMKKQIKKDLIQNLEKYFLEKNNKNIILNNNLNLGLSYITTDLNEFDCRKVDNEKILKLINQTLDFIKEKYLFKQNDFKKIPKVKALTQFKNYLLLNKDATIINNRKLNKPNSQIRKKYNYIQSAISRHGLKRKNKNKLTINNEDDNINILKNKFKLRNLTTGGYKKNNKIIKNDILKNILETKNNDIFLGRKINMDFGSFSYEEEAKKIQINDALAQEHNNTNAYNQLQEITKETEESNYKALDRKNNDYDNYFISNMNENEKKYEKENTKKLKGLNYMLNNFIKEKNLLKGFQIEERKGFMYLFKNIRSKYKNNGELYEEDMELLRRTNPIAFKIQQKKDEFDMKQLMKKINTQRINADNVMKGKKLQIPKTIEVDE